MTDLRKIPTELLVARVGDGLGVLDRHVHVAKLQANNKVWAELARTLELVGAAFDNVDDAFGELERRGRLKNGPS